ncbi:hypothetical protein RF11_08526 [Thelohanellus kitauei]|uniref:ShKT domain-containing protein n=1 Tax=Thelohanellus kitauei TaxID=669202 RepID=A0A0C2N7Z4_THEKT|nr:hypothetical protein RF11_08526 [Thelohanellus kitauei]
MIFYSESGSSRPRHSNTQNLIMSKITKLKKYLIPGGDIDIKKATQSLANILENNMNHKITKAKEDFETKLLSILDKRILLTAEMLRESKDCRDTIQNCENLKENNVCNTSVDAMNKTCRKTCGFCKDIDITLEDIISAVKQDVSQISQVLKPQTIHHFKPKHGQKVQAPPIKYKHVKPTKHPEHSKKPLKKKQKHPKPTHHKAPPKKIVRKPKNNECPEICKSKCLTGCPKKCCSDTANETKPYSDLKQIIPPPTSQGMNTLSNQNFNQPPTSSFGTSQPTSSSSTFFTPPQLLGQSQLNSMYPPNGASQSNGMYGPNGPSQSNSMYPTNGLSQSNSMYPTNGLSQSNGMYPTNGMYSPNGASQSNVMYPSNSASQSNGMYTSNNMYQPNSLSQPNGISLPNSMYQPNSLSQPNGIPLQNGPSLNSGQFPPSGAYPSTCPSQCKEQSDLFPRLSRRVLYSKTFCQHGPK